MTSVLMLRAWTFYSYNLEDALISQGKRCAFPMEICCLYIHEGNARSGEDMTSSPLALYIACKFPQSVCEKMDTSSMQENANWRKQIDALHSMDW
jgi:hypothetical protein